MRKAVAIAIAEYGPNRCFNVFSPYESRFSRQKLFGEDFIEALLFQNDKTKLARRKPLKKSNSTHFWMQNQILKHKREPISKVGMTSP